MVGPALAKRGLGAQITVATRVDVGIWASGDFEMNSETQKVAVPATNLERLRGHLKMDTLADRLVGAGIAATPEECKAAFQKVIEDRLAELKKKHDPV